MNGTENHPLHGLLARAMESGTTPAKSFEAALNALQTFEQTLSDGQALGARTWDQFLGWCLATTGSHSACVTDPRGLVVAAKGEMEHEVVEQTAAHMAMAMEQALRMAGEGEQVESITVRYRRHCLTALPIVPNGSSPLIAIVVGKQPVEPALMPDAALAGASWTEILQWATSSFQAKGSFLVDKSGLVIARVGVVDMDSAGALGTRLSLIVSEVANKPMGGQPEMVVLRIGSRWLAGCSVPMTRQRTVTAGVIGHTPPTLDHVRRMRRILKARLKKPSN